MSDATRQNVDQVSAIRVGPRVAVVGAGLAGLSCARELAQLGYLPVVFEASDRVGGRCSSRNTRIGVFDDASQVISGPTQLETLANAESGQLSALHPWTIRASAAEAERETGEMLQDEDEAEAGATPVLRSVGSVGVPSMLALAQALARPLDVRMKTSVQRAFRRGSRWVLSGSAGDIDEDFRALVVAVPAPVALPLVTASQTISDVLRPVRFASRWVLLLGSERPVPLPGYRVFQGSPIERVAGMHTKPGRGSAGPQRWFIEADQRWSIDHERDDAETVAELLLDNFRAHAIRSVAPNYLCALQWRHAFVQNPAAQGRRAEVLWDEQLCLGVCGDSVVASRVDRVHHSGMALARRVDESLNPRSQQHLFEVIRRRRDRRLEIQL
jgi:renalase